MLGTLDEAARGNPRLLSRSQAANYCNISTSTFSSWVRSRKLPPPRARYTVAARLPPLCLARLPALLRFALPLLPPRSAVFARRSWRAIPVYLDDWPLAFKWMPLHERRPFNTARQLPKRHLEGEFCLFRGRSYGQDAVVSFRNL
jgi:hypothetical protein